MFVKDIAELLNQRPLVYLLGAFFSLVLFNTTYMDLGTYVPIIVITLTLIFALSARKSGCKQSYGILFFSVIVFLSTLLSGGEISREVEKIFLNALLFVVVTSLFFSEKEVRFLSFVIFVSYLVYAVLVFQAIGTVGTFYGRTNIIILNSDYPLDPNVTASVFALPVVIGLYNFLYGRLKLLSIIGIIVFLVALVACASRGAFLGLIGASLLLLHFVSGRRGNLFYKTLLIGLVVAAIGYAMFYAINDESLFGMERILDADDEDVSNGRVEIWTKRLMFILKSPIWGYGANYSIGPIHCACHNTFIQILYYGGIFGLWLFFKPIVRVLKRKQVSVLIKYALFASVFVPVFFIDTLQERTLWNFLIIYELLSREGIGEDALLWLKKTKISNKE